MSTAAHIEKPFKVLATLPLGVTAGPGRARGCNLDERTWEWHGCGEGSGGMAIVTAVTTQMVVVPMMPTLDGPSPEHCERKHV